jgi:alpha-glucosidase
MLVGEVVFSDPARVASYVRDDELHLAFNFTLLFEEWDAERIRAAVDATRASFAEVGATPTWVLENHDVTRQPTRYGDGDGEIGLRRARAACLLLLALPGVAFLYQGQELGLEEVDLPDERRQDPVFVRTKGARKGRDGCRVPIPWQGGPPGFGFTTGEPWLPIPGHWAGLSVAVQREDPASTLSLYRSALALRPAGDGFAWRESPSGSLVFERDDILCLVNVAAPEFELPAGEVVLASDPGLTKSLPANTAAWARTTGDT